MNRRGCITTAVSGCGCALFLFILLPGFLMGAGPLFSILHLEGDSYSRYAGGGSYSGADPAISPDGKTIAYSSPRTGRGDIYAVNVDGTGTRQLTSDPLYEAQPCFSPDGQHIVYVKQMKYILNSYHSHLWLMNADGSGQRRVTNDDTEYINPVYMADGAHVFCLRCVEGRTFAPVIVSLKDGSYRAYSSDEGETDVVTRTGIVRKRYNGEGWSYSASPDSKLVVFCSDPYSQTLWLMNIDGNGRHQVYSNLNHYLEHPTFTPDGKRILFHETTDNGVGDIMLINLDGTNPIRVGSTK